MNTVGLIDRLVLQNESRIVQKVYSELVDSNELISNEQAVKVLKDMEINSHWGFDCGFVFFNFNSKIFKQNGFPIDKQVSNHELIKTSTLVRSLISVQSMTLKGAVLREVREVLVDYFKSEGYEIISDDIGIESIID